MWKKLFEALSVAETDVVWARWLQEEFELRRNAETKWSLSELPRDEAFKNPENKNLRIPARQFVRDLESIFQAKKYMTRRQWVSLLEAVLRLSCASHVLWLCDVNHLVWQSIREAINAAKQFSTEEVTREIVSSSRPFLTYGNPAVPIIRDYASRYLIARIGINLVLLQLELQGVEIKSIRSCEELCEFLGKVFNYRKELKTAGTEALVASLKEGDTNARTIACKKGIGSNLVEFSRYVLGQRQTANDSLRGYDQGFILRKKTEHPKAPWIVSMGPVAILAIVHCCLRDAAGPRSITKLCHHLSNYGIQVDRDNVTTGELGKKLRMLGLVLDSPDAESGMLLVPPFGGSSRVPHL